MAAASPATRASILDATQIPSEGNVRAISPGENLADEPGEAFDQVVVDHVLAFESDPAKRLREIGQLLKPGGRLILAEVFRKRGLPTDLLRQRLLHQTGLASAILLADVERLLSEAGFRDVTIQPASIDIDQWITRLDQQQTTSCAPPRVIGEEEWIASTQACCGLGGHASEKLSELLRCDDVQSLWAVLIILACRK